MSDREEKRELSTDASDILDACIAQLDDGRRTVVGGSIELKNGSRVYTGPSPADVAGADDETDDYAVAPTRRYVHGSPEERCRTFIDEHLPDWWHPYEGYPDVVCGVRNDDYDRFVMVDRVNARGDHLLCITLCDGDEDTGPWRPLDTRDADSLTEAFAQVLYLVERVDDGDYPDPATPTDGDDDDEVAA